MQLRAAVNGSGRESRAATTATTKPIIDGRNDPVAESIAGKVRAASVT